MFYVHDERGRGRGGVPAPAPARPGNNGPAQLPTVDKEVVGARSSGRGSHGRGARRSAARRSQSVAGHAP
ncbi:hypothetical protein EVAR_8407_1 [Eumeta japonica]|uniref:Uncharacterized protein n=1 Tax=Eumeta variegata TaxID=151549 RepID=A0A4C1WEE5_EUMVA|nr:hypothetical protein EVAR_8407_1 [Eumeta japonica]